MAYKRIPVSKETSEQYQLTRVGSTHKEWKGHKEGREREQQGKKELCEVSFENKWVQIQGETKKHE